jgi:acetyl-CoA acyltransferase 1
MYLSIVVDSPDNGGPQLALEIAQNGPAADCPKPMGWTSENVAEDFNISREDMDHFSAISFQRAEHAAKSGYFKNEIVPFTAYKKDPATGERAKVVITQDDGIRPGMPTSLSSDTLLEVLSFWMQG